MPYNLNYVYSSKAKYIKEAVDRFVEKNSSIVEIFDNAVILPAVQYHDYDVGFGRGGVVDSEGNYIESSKTKARMHGYYNPEEYGIETSDEKVVFCGYFHKAWGHFLTEVVSRLWYALKNDNSIDAYVFVDDLDGNKTFSGNYLEFLKLLGIADLVRIINRPIRYKTVILPESGMVYDEYYTTEFKKMYEYINRKGLEQYEGPKYEKVFFSKRKQVISVESNINEKFVDKYFVKNGYKLFYPERLSLIDTIGIMQNARFFCALSSSLAHNQLFGHSRQTMISIEKQAFFNPYQIFVANITDCECVFIDACRCVFTVGASGPFIFDYTKFLDQYAIDNNLIRSKPMSALRFRRLFRRYLAYYFDYNSVLPPDYMYHKYIVDITREAYNDTVETEKLSRMSLYNRVIIKLKKKWISWS